MMQTLKKLKENGEYTSNINKVFSYKKIGSEYRLINHEDGFFCSIEDFKNNFDIIDEDSCIFKNKNLTK